MTVRPIRLFGDPILRSATRPVEEFGPRLRGLVTDLMDTVDAPGRAGLAAPQIGVTLRVFSYLVGDEHGYVINPEIVSLSSDKQEGDEGCLSVPELWFPLRRAARAVVRGVDVDNRPIEVEGTGLLARCLQHEVDHLDGTVYLDRLPRGHRREALRAVRGADWFQRPVPRTWAPRSGIRPQP